MPLSHPTWSRRVTLGWFSLGMAILSFLSSNAQAQRAPLKVACLGDSITAGYNLPAADAYPVKLQTSLGSSFAVQGYGLNGAAAMIPSRSPFTSSYWASSAYQSAKSFAPNVIILKLGSNDAKTTNDTQRGVDHVNFVTDVEASIDELRALPSLPTVFLCTPFYAKGDGFSISANTLNNSLAPLIRQIALRKNCTLIDLHALQAGNTIYYQSGDNIHPNAAGMTLIANKVSSVLTSHYGQPLEGAFYRNSWIGNTFGTPADHIPHNIDNLYVTPSGKVATITGWDEGGANVALYSATGSKVGVPADSGTGSWGRISGKAVFADDNYVYQSMSQQGGYDADDVNYPSDPNVSWKCIRRFNQDGSSAPFNGGKGYDDAMLVINTDGSDLRPTGLVVYNSELFVSDPVSSQIKVYNASTMSSIPVRSFAVTNPGLLDYDRLGFIWMLDSVTKQLFRFSTTGVIQAQSIAFPAAVIPTGFCVDKVNDRILVTNNGNDQNVLIYTSIFDAPSQTSTFGNTGGINSGTAGVMGPLKFCEPKGVGIDSSGNIFVGNNSITGGAYLEKYNSGGSLQWRLNGLIFTAVGELNPTNEGEFYSPEFKFNMNLANTIPGSEWSPAAMTLNKVKYPGDPRIFTPGEGNRIRSTAYVRNVGGRKLLYVSDMYGSFLAIYRFNAATDGETAIPSGLFDESDPNETLWLDANGNGAKDAGETQSKVADSPNSQQTYPDVNGGVWKANRGQGVRYFPLQGFDTHGNPQYTYASSVTYALPELAADARRLDYDAVNDVLYAAGASANGALGTGDWGTAGDRLVRYNHFLGARTTAWSISLPFSATMPNDGNVKGFCEAGDYLFLAAYRSGRIYVHRKSDGSKVGEMLPTAATNNASGWSDIMSPIRATKRSNGEYLIFAEENGFGKIMMYRWRPTVVSPPLQTNVTLSGNATISGSSVVKTATASDQEQDLRPGRIQTQTFSVSTAFKLGALYIEYQAPGGGYVNGTFDLRIFTVANVNAGTVTPGTLLLSIPITLDANARTAANFTTSTSVSSFLKFDLTGADEITLAATTGNAGYCLQFVAPATEPATTAGGFFTWRFSTGSVYANGRFNGSTTNDAPIVLAATAGDPGTISIPEGALVLAGNTATITIPSSTPGFSYSLFYSDSLAVGSWLPVDGNPQAGGGVLTWTNDITGAPKRFYRMAAK